MLAFVVARGCQESQVRISEEQAIATAREQVDFEPRRTNIRLLRQGVGSKPFWFVNLSVPGDAEGTVRRLTVVKIDANTGTVVALDRQR